MNEKSFHHSWNGEHAHKFAKSVENLKKSRYIPFAKEIYEFINKFVTNKKPIILDVGCGPGLLLIEIANLLPNSQLIGIDFSKDMLQIASEKATEKGINSIIFKQGPAEDIPLPDDHNDAVVCLNSLHDFNSAKETISEVHRTMKEEGIFILKDKNGAFPKWKVVLGFIPLIFKSGFKRTLRYFKSNELWLNPEKVKECMEDLGFIIVYLKKKLDYLIVGKK
jgi:ubiquinone/menaquinone biosynthesis C-methylase UbiE